MNTVNYKEVVSRQGLGINYSSMNHSVRFDVADTLGRASSALLSRGIRIELGDHAATNCRDTIFLPQATKRFLSSREIDLVRYMVAHEQAHIKHSNPKAIAHASEIEQRLLSESIFQALEDVRIESVAMGEFAGHSRTFEIGRRIALE